MTAAISLVFPHQLFRENPCLHHGRTVVLLEDRLYFTQFSFHRQKLLLHRASMKFYSDFLKEKKYDTAYISCHEHEGLKTIFQKLRQDGVKEVHYTETSDYLLERRLERYAAANDIALKFYPSPAFLTDARELEEMLGGKRRYLLANFYMRQRKRLGILTIGEKPVGGKWSFDTDNRRKLPAGVKPPALFFPGENQYTDEARQYVRRFFPDNPGDVGRFIYPVTFDDAEKNLEDFLENRMYAFGIYEDAIAKHESFLFHALLTPALNTGLLTPKQVIEKTLEHHRVNNYPLNSLEGFIRQVIGWREFMRGIYEREGVFQRTNNFWNFSRKIPACFYEATTGIEPVDVTVRKIHRYAFCHHIERLMALGSFMLLCEFHPDDVYRWFMELFIDAYDWVMVPNVYGMSQYADGGLITTKPYVCGSNYILKMSDFKQGAWCDTWDGLFWRFIHVHREVFARNQRMSMMVRQSDNMPREKLNRHLRNAETFLAGL